MPAGTPLNFKAKLEFQRKFCYTNSSKYLTPSANDASAARQQWLLSKLASPPSGVRWYDNTGNPITGTPERYLTPGETKTLSALKLMPVSYNSSNISQTFEWSSSNTNVATVNASTGQVTTVAPGTATIRARADIYAEGNGSTQWNIFYKEQADR